MLTRFAGPLRAPFLSESRTEMKTFPLFGQADRDAETGIEGRPLPKSCVPAHDFAVSAFPGSCGSTPAEPCRNGKTASLTATAARIGIG